MALRGHKAELVTASKPKFLISGKPGVGKTFFALDFPNPYLIDTENGGNRIQYMKKLKEVNGLYLGPDQGSQDFDTVIEEVKTLATTKHDRKTLILDSFSHLYLLTAAKAEAEIGNDFGKDKKEANKPTRQLMRWLEKVDMTVILICHSKDKWVRKGKEVIQEGTTFDGWEKMEYALDLWIEIEKIGKDNRTFIVRKSRIDNLPETERMPLQYKHFADLYGKNIIEKEAQAIPIATPEQIERIKKLVEMLKIDSSEIEKLFSKANVEDFSEMNQSQIVKCIEHYAKKIQEIQEVK